MILQVGKATKGTEAKGPACDRISARSAEAIVGNKRCVLKSTSRQAAATLCHPNRGKPGSSSTVAELGRNPSAKSAMFYLGQSYSGQFLLRPVLLRPGST